MAVQSAVKAIAVKEFASKIIKGERVFILDVHNTAGFDDWKVEGKNKEDAAP